MSPAVGARRTVGPPRGHPAARPVPQNLFTVDDLRLVATLGQQAGILAERIAIITEQRRLAEQLAESVAALTHANQAKNDFLAA
jgi:GAF domain-containing protein